MLSKQIPCRQQMVQHCLHLRVVVTLDVRTAATTWQCHDTQFLVMSSWIPNKQQNLNETRHCRSHRRCYQCTYHYHPLPSIGTSIYHHGVYTSTYEYCYHHYALTTMVRLQRATGCWVRVTQMALNYTCHRYFQSTLRMPTAGVGPGRTIASLIPKKENENRIMLVASCSHKTFCCTSSTVTLKRKGGCSP